MAGASSPSPSLDIMMPKASLTLLSLVSGRDVHPSLSRAPLHCSYCPEEVGRDVV